MENLEESIIQNYNEGDYATAYKLINSHESSLPPSIIDLKNDCLLMAAEQQAYIIREYISRGLYKEANDCKAQFTREFGSIECVTSIQVPEPDVYNSTDSLTVYDGTSDNNNFDVEKVLPIIVIIVALFAVICFVASKHNSQTETNDPIEQTSFTDTSAKPINYEPAAYPKHDDAETIKRKQEKREEFLSIVNKLDEDTPFSIGDNFTCHGVKFNDDKLILQVSVSNLGPDEIATDEEWESYRKYFRRCISHKQDISTYLKEISIDTEIWITNSNFDEIGSITIFYYDLN